VGRLDSFSKGNSDRLSACRASQGEEANLSKHENELRGMLSSYFGRDYIIPQIRIIVNLESVLDRYV
jgi:hypothetical protein